jgi:hypothetical protein
MSINMTVHMFQLLFPSKKFAPGLSLKAYMEELFLGSCRKCQLK